MKHLGEILAFYSGAAEGSLGAMSSPRNTPGWDSAANLYFIAAIEDAYAVTFATRDVVKLRTLGDFAAYLAGQDARAIQP